MSGGEIIAVCVVAALCVVAARYWQVGRRDLPADSKRLVINFVGGPYSGQTKKRQVPARVGVTISDLDPWWSASGRESVGDKGHYALTDVQGTTAVASWQPDES